MPEPSPVPNFPSPIHPVSLPGTPPPPRRRRVWLWFLVIPAAMIFIVAMVAGFGFLYAWTARETTVTESDRGKVLGIQDLAGWMEGFAPDPAFASIRKLQYFDRSWEIEYEYDDPSGKGPYLTCTVGWEPKISDAVTGYLAVWHGAALGLRYGSGAPITIAERDELFRWGDQSRLGLLMRDGKPVGNVFAARKGKTTFYVLLTGVYFDEPADFEALLGPVLERNR